jgi:hypothetical protein
MTKKPSEEDEKRARLSRRGRRDNEEFAEEDYRELARFTRDVLFLGLNHGRLDTTQENRLLNLLYRAGKQRERLQRNWGKVREQIVTDEHFAKASAARWDDLLFEVEHHLKKILQEVPSIPDPQTEVDLSQMTRIKRPFGKSVIDPCGARIGVIQAGDVDAAELGSNGPDRQEDEALPVGSDG